MYLARAEEPARSREELARIDRADQLPAETLYLLVLALEALGERVRALAMLDKAIAAGHSVAELGKDPELTDLRADPAYHRMMLKHAQNP